MNNQSTPDIESPGGLKDPELDGIDSFIKNHVRNEVDEAGDAFLNELKEKSGTPEGLDEKLVNRLARQLVDNPRGFDEETRPRMAELVKNELDRGKKLSSRVVTSMTEGLIGSRTTNSPYIPYREEFEEITNTALSSGSPVSPQAVRNLGIYAQMSSKYEKSFDKAVGLLDKALDSSSSVSPDAVWSTLKASIKQTPEKDRTEGMKKNLEKVRQRISDREVNPVDELEAPGEQTNKQDRGPDTNRPRY